MSSTRPRLLVICLCALFALLAESAFATHFRYGYMFWERDLTFSSADPNLVRVKVTVDVGGRWTYPAYNNAAAISGFAPATRCTAGAASCCAGVVTTSTDMGALSCPNVGAMFDFSGGTLIGVKVEMPAGGAMQVYRQHLTQTPATYNFPVAGGVFPAIPSTQFTVPMTPVVNQVIATQDTFYSRMIFYMVFDKRNRVRATWENGARVSALLDGNNDQNWKIQTMIDLTGANVGVIKSPITQAPAIMQVITGVTNTIALPSQTFDNTIAKWRLATTAESALINPFPVSPSVFSLNPDTGVVTFRPRANGLYAAQFILSAFDPLTGLTKASVPLDVMFSAITGTPTTSSLATGDGLTTYTATVPQPFSFQVRSTTTPANSSYTVTINPGVLPGGATFTQPNCNGGSVCVGTFNWTPSVTSTGSVACFTSTVTLGVTMIATSAPLCVTIDLNPLETTLVAYPAEGAAGGGPIVLKARLARALDDGPISGRPVTFTFDGSPSNPPWVQTDLGLGVDTIATNTSGIATLTVTSTAPVNPAAPYRATFNAVSGEFLTSSSAINVLSVKVATTTLNAPVVQTPPVASIGFPLTVSAVLNRHFTDGGVFGVGAIVRFTLSKSGQPDTVLMSGPTNAQGVATVTFPASAVPTGGPYTIEAWFGGNASLYGFDATTPTAATTSVTPIQRTQLTMSAGIASQNIASPVSAVLVAIPSNAPLAGKSVTFSSPGVSNQTVTTDASGVATAMMTFTSIGTKVVTASYSPVALVELNRNGAALAETSAANIDVQPPVATQLTIPGFSGVAGQPGTLTAHLQTTTGTPLSGQTITFTIAGVSPSPSGTTNASGDVALTFTPPSEASANYSANFPGVVGYVASSASNGYVVVKAATSMSLNAPDGVVGATHTVSATLTRTTAPAGVVSGVTISFFKSGAPGDNTTLTATTDASGTATVVFSTLPTPSQYSISATFAGNTALTSSQAQKAVMISQRTTLQLAAATGYAGAAIPVSATLIALPSNAPIPGRQVTFTFSDGSLSATTNSQGVAQVSKLFAVAGAAPVTASFGGLSLYTDENGVAQPTVASGSVTVEAAATQFAPLTAGAVSLIGDALAVSTSLSRTTAPAGPVSGATVNFALTGPAPGGATTNQAAATTATGAVSTTFTPTARGQYSLNAAFGGTTSLAASSATSTTVGVYQRTKLVVTPPVSPVAGVATTVSAALVAIPSNTPLAGKLVTFTTSAGGVGPTTAVTDANGVASAAFVFPIAGPVSITGSFLDVPNYFANNLGQLAAEVDASSAAAVSVASAPTTLSPLSMPSTGLVGSSIAVSTSLSAYGGSPVAGANVSFIVTQPDGAPLTLNATTQADGSATASIPASQRGVYTVVAQYAGNSALVPATTAPASVSVYQRTSLTLTAPATVLTGQSVTFTATLIALPGNTGIAGQIVSFDSPVSGPQTLTTNLSGVATFTFTPAASGVIGASALFQNGAGYFATAAGDQLFTAATATVNVSKATTSLANLASPAASTIGSTLTVSTVLTRTGAPVGPAAGETVTFTVTDPNGSTSFSGTAVTGLDGVASYTFTPATRGMHTIAASFAATAALEASSTNTASTAVLQRTTLAIAPAAGSAAKQTTISATLTNAPGGAPLAGQTVAFSFTDGSWATATTNGLGVAQVTVTFAAVGDYVSTATFSNAAGFYTDSTGAFPIVATTATGSVHVTNTAPTILDLPNITASATSAAGRVVNFTSTGNDAEDGALTPVCDATSGATFPIGPTSVSCTVTDAAGATASDSFTITITNNAPTFTAPANISLPVNIAAGRVVTFTALGSDTEDGTLHADCEARSGETFPLGTTNIACTVTDVAGATASGSFTITITNTAPTILDLPNISASATSAAGRMVSFASTGNDAEDGALIPACTATSGATFPIGTTNVSCTVTDIAGATASDSFTITITNNAPTFTAPANISLPVNIAAGRVVTFTALGSDVEDGTLHADCEARSGETFPLGTTNIACTVTDVAGATASGSFSITITNTAPTIVDLQDLAGEATSAAGRPFTFTSSGDDAEDGGLTPVCTAGSGSSRSARRR